MVLDKNKIPELIKKFLKQIKNLWYNKSIKGVDD
jgi:hypothetical protein